MTKKSTKRFQIKLNEEQKELFSNIARYSLGILVTGAALATILFAPNALQIFALLPSNKKKFSENDFMKVRNKLIEDRYVRFIEIDGKEFLEITNKGRKKLIEYEIDTIQIKKQEWSKKWYIVAFEFQKKTKLPEMSFAIS